jgi:hypothetical protein
LKRIIKKILGFRATKLSKLTEVYRDNNSFAEAGKGTVGTAGTFKNRYQRIA